MGNRCTQDATLCLNSTFTDELYVVTDVPRLPGQWPNAISVFDDEYVSAQALEEAGMCPNHINRIDRDSTPVSPGKENFDHNSCEGSPFTNEPGGRESCSAEAASAPHDPEWWNKSLLPGWAKLQSEKIVMQKKQTSTHIAPLRLDTEIFLDGAFWSDELDDSEASGDMRKTLDGDFESATSPQQPEPAEARAGVSEKTVEDIPCVRGQPRKKSVTFQSNALLVSCRSMLASDPDERAQQSDTTPTFPDASRHVAAETPCGSGASSHVVGNWRWDRPNHDGSGARSPANCITEQACCELVCMNLKGELKRVCATRRPLGVKFSKQAARSSMWSAVEKWDLAVCCVQPGSHADELGLQIGWLIKEVDCQDFDNQPDSAKRALREGLARLPDC
jgi:hypothetical protein